MVTTRLKSKIDALWLEFHSGGVTNPITVIEQISYLMFARLLDISETRHENRAARLGGPHEALFSADRQHLRWSRLRNLGGDDMLRVVRDEFFPFLRTELEKRSALGRFLRDANCLIPTGNLLVRAVNAIEELPLTEGDTKGDLYEYLLSKLSTAGIAGQFRTPRHIIRLMAAMLDPQPTDRCCDPAAGTAGFLVGIMEYLIEKYSTPALVEETRDEDGTITRHYPGDLLEPYRQHIQNDLLHGFDFDQTMLRIAAMNLLLHGIESPSIQYQDTLNTGFSERFPKLAKDAFDVIAANPPFKGTIDADNMDPNLRSRVKTKKSELLFLVLILRLLKSGGRAAVIVPDGVLFGSSGAHLGVRQMLVDENQLEAVISLPAGVFKPYAGVSTAILFFTKGGETKDVWFYDVQADGLSLDDKRSDLLPPAKQGPTPLTPLSEEEHAKNNLPDVLTRWRSLRISNPKSQISNPEAARPRTAQSFLIPKSEIQAQNYDLSLNRYKLTEHKEATYAKPAVILHQLKTLEQSILADLDELEELLK
jgi:type I restriction enzyme M protein